MKDIPEYINFTKIEPIHKGWTGEQKYYIETTTNQQLLLRITDASKYDYKKAQQTLLKRVSELDIPISRPVGFGLCDDKKKVYQLLTWLEGEDVESLLPTITNMEQYNLGLKAGKLLRKIHSVAAPKGTEDWDTNFDRMLRGEIEAYRSRMDIQSELGDIIIHYVKENRDIIGVRAQTFIHGDYNPGNLIIMPNGELGAIDFNCSYGDRYWDIFKVSWRPECYAYFYSGQIRGYFDGEPTLEFWNAYTYYFAFGALIASSAPQWAGFNTPDEGKAVVKSILDWSDNFKNPKPKWYINKY